MNDLQPRILCYEYSNKGIYNFLLYPIALSCLCDWIILRCLHSFHEVVQTVVYLHSVSEAYRIHNLLKVAVLLQTHKRSGFRDLRPMH